MADKIRCHNRSEVTVRNSDLTLSKTPIWVERDDFYGGADRRRKASEPFMVIGFDTEYKTPEQPLSNDQIRAGLAKNQILSYQVYCKLYDPAAGDAATPEWGGVCFPNGDGERLSLADVIMFAVASGVRNGTVKAVPTRMYLVGHFTRADIPAFSDFQDLTQMMSSVRNTFLSIDGHIGLTYDFPDGDHVDLKILLRDTMLLTPATSKGLKALGELVGQEKITLDPDPDKEQWYKENMDCLMRDNPVLFDHYALTDAVICVRYIDKMLEQSRELFNTNKIPATLTGIGVDLLLKNWDEQWAGASLDLLGKEKIKERIYDKRLGYYRKTERIVDQQEVAWHLPLATECYHGGRNEQFWFGPCFDDDWTDYDLSSAYPTAMALIGRPEWSRAFVTSKIEDFTCLSLGVANVEFEFPKSVRFPTMPVRTDNGLIFPRKGLSNCAAPEIALARSLGAKLKIRHGVVVPTDPSKHIFGDFIGMCVQKRSSFPKGSLENLFWKELSNSTYGKTAQGLQKKRVFDLKAGEMAELPPSKITNPYYAAYITSFVRAVLGEIINGLPENVCVFSCTTDGFLTNASEPDIATASQGPLVNLYAQSRHRLTGDPTVLEVKHRVRQLLGWRTRGQATLKQGGGAADDKSNVVLAKGGIHLPHHFDDVWLQNQRIVEMFFDRSPDDMIPMKVKTGVRDMVLFDADLVDRSLSKRLNMEFDWKRRPHAVRFSEAHGHIAFSTEPWDNIDQFMEMRRYWEAFALQPRLCLKTMSDYRQFAVYVMSQSALEQDARYLHRKAPDLKRLRQSLGAAWRHSKAGLTWGQYQISNTEFAEILTEAGIDCARADVENAARKPFEPKKCPPTPDVFLALSKLTRQFPDLEIDQFIVQSKGHIDLLAAETVDCPFISRI